MIFRKLKAFFISDYAFFLAIASAIILVSFIPFLYGTWVTPPGRVYLGTHNYEGDYPMYPAGIIQGQHGKLTSLDKFTSEPQQGTWIHGLYLWLGWLTAPLKTNPILVYHLARLAGGFLFALAIFVLIRQFFIKPGERNLAFLLAYAISSWPHLSFAGGKISLLHPFLPWWSGGEVMRRVTFLPHSLVRDSLMIFLFAWWIKVLRQGKVRYLPVALAAGFILSFFGPLHQAMVWFLLGLGVVIVFFQEVRTGKLGRTKNVVKTAILYITFSLPSLFYILQVFSVNPWKWIKDWEVLSPRITPFFEWVGFVGPTFLLALPAMAVVFLRRGMARMLLLGFALVTIFGIFSRLPQSFGIISFRFFGVPLHVPFGIFAADTLLGANRLLRLRLLAPVVAAFLLALSLPLYFQSLEVQIKKYATNVINVYAPQPWYEAMRWLDENTDPDDIVLSSFLTGNTIPAISGNTTYVGHYVSTLRFDEKNASSQTFFAGKMGPEEARRFLIDNRIDYVFFSPQESYLGGNPAIYSFLELVFENRTTKIYKFI